MLISILLQRYGRYDDQGASGGGDLFDAAIGFVVLALGVAFVLFAFYGLVAFFSWISGADKRERERKLQKEKEAHDAKRWAAMAEKEKLDREKILRGELPTIENPPPHWLGY